MRPSPHDRDLVGQGQRLVLVVGDQDRGRAGVRAGRATTARPVLSRRAASSEENGSSRSTTRVRGQGSGEGDPLLLAAGELGRVGGRRRRAGSSAGRAARAAGGRCARAAAGRRGCCRDVEVREQRALLRHVADPRAAAAGPTCGAVGDRLAVDRDRARVGREEAGDQPQQRGLAAARRAQHGDDLAVVDVEIDAVERPRRRRTTCAARVTLTAAHASSRRPRGRRRLEHERGRERDRTSSSAYGAAAPYDSDELTPTRTRVASVRVPIGASSRVAVSSVDDGDEDQRGPGAEAGRDQRQRHPRATCAHGRWPERCARRPRAPAGRARGGAHADHRARQEQDRVGREQDGSVW